MGSTVLIRPNKIFTISPPPPPPWPASTSLTLSPTQETSSFAQWKKSNKTLYGVLSGLQNALRSLHKRKVLWPVENNDSASISTPSEYMLSILQPISNIFNQLNPPGYFKTPMKCALVDLGHSLRGFTFSVEEFKRWKLTAPIVIPLPGDLFLPEGEMHANVHSALSLALEHSPAATIIITNFTDIAIFLPSTRSRPEPTFERVSTTHPSLALRVLATAYLLEIDPVGRLLNTPRPDMDIDQEAHVFQGPPKDPSQLLPDAELFATYHRHSDFDMVTLMRDRASALQFFRWHEHMAKNVPKIVAQPDDVLTAQTNEAEKFSPASRPIYPFDASEIPSDTAAHIQEIQRESPLVAAQVDQAFRCSKSFTIKIQDVVSKGSGYGICTVYRCQITTVDDVPVSTPSLCLKLFDDRFQPLHGPEDDELNQDPSTWLTGIVYAEMYALNEAFAYDKLLPVQGSVVPWFYGTHKFTLPDGTFLYGLLMEYIEGWTLKSNLTRKMSPERQISVIQSGRHAVRVLDVADIAQCDWHHEQLLLCNNSATKPDHVVLIDFASTMQTWDVDEPILLRNFIHMFRVLLGKSGDSGLDPELVWKYYGEPDDWDPVRSWIPKDKEGKEICSVHARNMFDYISSV
ncbi:hypothetical protein FB446DRAFT_753756 [Lentinula raphanica]|nr:hypothetical protein FB446DRAFT_753756 [Lentinula raphanica]